MNENEEQTACRILIVDDEENILSALERQLVMEDFEVFTALNAMEGLKILGKEKIDIVISDLRMPKMDGITFLSAVASEYPGVDRILLSGFLDESVVVQSITKGIASTYFTKPWDINTIIQTLNNLKNTRKQFQNNRLLARLEKIEKLPTSPEIYKRFMNALQQDKSVKDIVEILEKDVSITAKILQIANSAYYGIRPTSSLQRAIMVIGLDATRDVVLTFSLINQLEWTDVQLQYLNDICVHSFMVNKYMTLFHKIKYDTNISPHLSSVGITHDIGQIILLQYFPDIFESVIKLQKQGKTLSFYDCELDQGYQDETHCEIGAYFLRSWDLPESSVTVALHHHRPEKASPNYRKILELVHFTDDLINYLKLKHFPDIHAPLFNQDWIGKEELVEFSKEIIKGLDETAIV